MQNFFGYVRVSTARQGEHGVSLQEQRDAIARYAARNNLAVAEWFEERETAARRGRPVFMRMLTLLRRGKADGVIIHKIDRGARNLKDWAELGDLSDQGVEIHFTEHSVDLRSRGGRLSADILAVVAADYVRNLRDEIRKGFYGRLKQGFYPLPAPLGYRDCGSAKPKTPDPATAPLVRAAFERYATGRYSLQTLRDELARRGLRNRRGGSVTVSGLSVLLRNPFYIGLIRLRRNGETFPGVHEPLVSKATFDRVRSVLTGKTATRIIKHDFLFRRLLSCGTCGYSLIGERQKGRVYYRCHTATCPPTSVREDDVNAEIDRRLATVQFDALELDRFRQNVVSIANGWDAECQVRIQRITLHRNALSERLTRLTDAYLDGVLDRDLFEQRKTGLLLEQKDADDRLASMRDGSGNLPDRLAEFLELVGGLYLSYKSAIPADKRELLRIVTSNRTVTGKNIDITLAPPFSEIGKHHENTNGGAYRGIPRTLDQLGKHVIRWLQENPDKQLTPRQDLEEVV